MWSGCHMWVLDCVRFVVCVEYLNLTELSVRNIMIRTCIERALALARGERERANGGG